MSELDPVSVAIQQIRKVEPGMTLEYIEGQLDDDQHAVLDRLKETKNMTKAAEDAGVNRSAVYRWLESDPFFIAAHNAWLAERDAAADLHLTALEDIALQSLEKALANDPKLAYKFLKDRGVTRKQKRGATDPGLVYQQLTADIAAQSPVTSPRALTELLTQAGLSRDQQRKLLILTLRSPHPQRAVTAE